MQNNIRKLREGSGITMTDLAIKAGVSVSSLSLIERQQSCIKSTAVRITEALGELTEKELTVGEVFEGAEFKR